MKVAFSMFAVLSVNGRIYDIINTSLGKLSQKGEEVEYQSVSIPFYELKDGRVFLYISRYWYLQEITPEIQREYKVGEFCEELVSILAEGHVRGIGLSTQMLETIIQGILIGIWSEENGFIPIEVSPTESVRQFISR